MLREVKNQRKSNFELLRILSMLMIVIWHVCVHGIEKNGDFSNMTEINNFIYYLIKSLTVVGVNIYILISGYFLCKSKYKLQKTVRLVFETFVFSMGIYLTLVTFGFVTFSIKTLVTSLFPVFFGEYWFVSVYLVLYLLSPYLNLVITNLTKESHLKMLSLLFAIDCVWQFIYGGINLGVNYGVGLFHFIFLYLLSSYIREYGFVIKNLKKSHYIFIYILLSLTISIGGFVLSGKIDRIYAYNSPLVVCMAYSIFMFFKHLSIKSNVINKSAVYVFGIYLIHDNDFMRDMLWNKFGIIETILNDNLMFFIKILGFGLLLFLVCWFVSYIVTSLVNVIFVFLDKKISN
jgi:surface polysaccharide O-acyltransferase-like enzyme